MGDWTKRGTCRGLETAIWFSDEAENQRFAKQVCAGCPVRGECLEWALKHEDYGVWGGFTAAERRRIQARRRGL